MRMRTTWILVWSAVLCLAATPASAQYGAKPMSDPATGESYHVEIGGYLWFPTPDILISSDGTVGPVVVGGVPCLDGPEVVCAWPKVSVPLAAK